MRLPALAALAALVAATPLALAQTGTAGEIRLSLADHSAPEPPGSRFAIPFVARVPCALAGEAATLHLAVARAPAWLAAVPSPEAVALASRDCPGDAFMAEGTVEIVLSPRAPARAPEAIRLTATLEGGEASAATHAERPIVVSFVPQLDLRVPTPTKLGEPQAVLEFPVEIENRGNGNTKVSFQIDEPTGGFRAPVPQPVTLEGAPWNGTPKKVTLPFTVTTPFQNGPNHGATLVTVRWTAKHALDPDLATAVGTFSFTARVEGNYLPGPAAPLALVAVAGLALAASRDRSSIDRPRAPREPKD